MKIILSTTHKEFFEFFSDNFCTDSDELFFYDEPMQFLCNIFCNLISGDVYLLDYNVYKPYEKYIYQFLFNMNRKIPIVFYNDFTIEEDSKIVNWLSVNEFNYDCFDFERFLPFFERVFNVSASIKSINDKILSEVHVSAAERPKLLKNSEKSVEKKEHFPPVMDKLFTFFKDNSDRDVSIGEIAGQLKIHYENQVKIRNEVYSYISRLKKDIENQHLGFEIVRTGIGFYKLMKIS